jgi:prepilin-type processing-associated H-X9-DG protein
MKRHLNSYWAIPVVLIIGAGVFMLFVSFMPIRHPVSKRAQCQVELRYISMALAMYNHDYEKFPPVIFSGETVGWAKGLDPYMKNNPDYLKSPQIFQCPSETHPAQDNPHLPGFTDYWINKNVGSADFNKLDVSFNVIIMGDGDGGSSASTASYAINELPASWQAENSPATRHNGGANYALRDGQVKWLKPNEVSQLPSSQYPSAYTFEIR